MHHPTLRLASNLPCMVQEEAKTSKSILSTSPSASGSRIPPSLPPSFLLLPPLLPLPPSSSNIDKGEREEGRKEFPFPCSDSAKGQILSLLSPLSLSSSLVVVYWYSSTSGKGKLLPHPPPSAQQAPIPPPFSSACLQLSHLLISAHLFLFCSSPFPPHACAVRSSFEKSSFARDRDNLEIHSCRGERRKGPPLPDELLSALL